MKSVDYIFDDLKIVQSSDHLKYGTDALLLSAFVKGSKYARAVDLGCGNGVISLCLAKKEKAGSVLGIDIQKSSAELAAESVIINGLSDKVSILCEDFTALPSSYCGSFDYAVSNPPYMKTKSGKSCISDAKTIARHECFCDIHSVCAAAARLVKFGGEFYAVYRPDRISDLFSALKENKLEPKRMTFVCSRAELAPCLVLVCAKSGASSGCVLTPTFFISNSDGEYTDAMKSVYLGGNI